MTAKHANSEVRRAVRDALFGDLKEAGRLMNGLRIPTGRRRTVTDRVYLDVTTALGDRPSPAQAEAMRQAGLQPSATTRRLPASVAQSKTAHRFTGRSSSS